MTLPTINERRYGIDAPLPTLRTLHAGPVTATLENGDLRYIRLGEHEIIRRLYLAVRDRNWNTIPANYTTLNVKDHGSHFRIDLVAEHVTGDVDFTWTGSIEGLADGTIRYQMQGKARKPFFRNRIGFCVLHPSDLAGTSALTQTPDDHVDGTFPLLISPDQPFIDMKSIAHPVGEGAVATISFSGDLFEMEDQRNWTDASYKTYSTPLRLPYPVEITPEVTIDQSVTLTVSGMLPNSVAIDGGEDVSIAVDFAAGKPLPPIGFGAGKSGTIEPVDLERMRALNPAHLWLELDLGSKNWRDRLAVAAARAASLGTPLHLAVVAAETEQGWSDLAHAIVDARTPVEHVFVFPAVHEPITFPRKDLATHGTTLADARAAFDRAEANSSLGGGSRAYFTELNRATSFLPIDDLASLTYTINPQIHASDNLSVIETLSAQVDTVLSARAIGGNTPVMIGPVTFRSPWNPNATEPTPPTGADELPTAVDARQLSLLGAGWTLGSIHRLASAGADAMTFYELYGWRGVIERRNDLSRRELFPSSPGQLFPLFHVFAVAAQFVGGEVLEVTLSAPFQVEALALRKQGTVTVLVASFNSEAASLKLEVPGLQEMTVTYLDESTYADSVDDPEFFLASGSPVSTEGDTVSLALLPFGVACLQGRLA